MSQEALLLSELFRGILIFSSGVLSGYVLGKLTVWLVKRKMARWLVDP